MVCLYDYQTDIISRLFESWRTQRSVMMQMPTGTGKTHVLASVVKSLTYNEDRGDVSLCHETGSDRSECDGGQIWIVAHRRELVAQIEETMERYGIDGNAGKVRAMSIQWCDIGMMSAENLRLSSSTRLTIPLPSAIRNCGASILKPSFWD